MLLEVDYIPAHTHGAEDIFLTAQSERANYERLKQAGYLATMTPRHMPRSHILMHSHAASIFAAMAAETADRNNRAFGTAYSTLDVIQAAAMLCVYYSEHVKECDARA